MLAKLRSHMFIDTLVFDLNDVEDSKLDAVLTDEDGNVCQTLDTVVPDNHKFFYWVGFNDLPYGVYTLEIASLQKKVRLNLVKRI